MATSSVCDFPHVLGVAGFILGTLTSCAKSDTLGANPVAAAPICSARELLTNGIVVKTGDTQFRVPRNGLDQIGANSGITILHYRGGGTIAFHKVTPRTLKGLGLNASASQSTRARALLFGPYTKDVHPIKMYIGNGQTLYARDKLNQPGFRTIVVFADKQVHYIDVRFPHKCFVPLLKTFRPIRK